MLFLTWNRGDLVHLLKPSRLWLHVFFSPPPQMGGCQIPSKWSSNTNSLEHRIFQTIYFWLFETSFTPTSILDKENNQSSELFNYVLLITCHFPPFNMRQEHVVWMSKLPFDAHTRMHTHIHAQSLESGIWIACQERTHARAICHL